MKRILVLFAFLPFLGNTQSLLGGKNIVKANLSSLLFGNYHVTYERALLKKMSISLSYGIMSKKPLPLQNLIGKYINDPNLDLGLFQVGNTAITPELRIYIGTGKMKGFYLAPYARFATTDFTVPVKYTYGTGLLTTTANALFSGKIKSSSGGLMIGTQHQILKKLVLDIWIVGGHYGSSSGELQADFSSNPLTGNTSDPYSQQGALQKALNDIKIDPFKFKGTVVRDTDGLSRKANIISDGPWAGIRALGFSLGLRF